MTRKKYVIYRFILAIAIFVVGSAIIDILMYGMYKYSLSDTIRWAVTGFLVSAMVLVSDSKHMRQLTAQQVGTVRMLLA